MSDVANASGAKSEKPIYGIDRSVYPGEVAMDWLRKYAGARFACFYLAPTPIREDDSWMDHRTALAVKGWGFIPTYVGQQARVKKNNVMVPNPLLSAKSGTTDGNQACDLATKAGFALGSIIHLDLEMGDVPSGAYQAYILAWIAAVTKREYMPAIYCPGGASHWALQYARIVWLAAPENLDADGNAIPRQIDPKNLPSPRSGHGFVATQFLWEIDFQGLSQPADGNHGPRFDLSTGLVADPSDYAAVDKALLDLASSATVADSEPLAVEAREAFVRFKAKQDFEIVVDAAAPPSPTSDPHCGPASQAEDKIMPDDKVALNLVETSIAVDWIAETSDTGMSEGDFEETLAAVPAASKPDRWEQVFWPKKDLDSPDYHHLADSGVLPLPKDGIPQPGEFQLTPEDIELVLAANRMNPIGYDNVVAFAIRGARLGRLADANPSLDVEDASSCWMTDTRPDHKHFRCLIGFYTRSIDPKERKFSLFTASTVPNAKYVESWYLLANKKSTSGIGNMMPSGCYVYRVGAHNSPHAGQIKPALRLTDSSNLHIDGTVTVLRAKNDESYGIDDVWCKTVPADNVHCSFQTDRVDGWGAPFSSAGCMTIRGKQEPTDQWKKAQAIMNKIGQGRRCDLVLVTGRDLAIAAELRVKKQAGDANLVQSELRRLRPGSQGPEIKALQAKLSLDQTGYFGSVLKKALVDEQSRRGAAIDGIYSPTLDSDWKWAVFAPPPPS